MVRTRGDNTARRAVGGKAPRKQPACSSSCSITSSPGSKDKYSGGNPVRWMPTPSWQKGIGAFLQKCNSSCDPITNEAEENGTTSSSQNSTSGQEQISEITSLD